MFSKLILVAVISAAGAPIASKPMSSTVGQQPVKAATPRPFHAINKQLRAAMRREATENNPAVWAATVVELAGLYSELTNDSRIATSGTLESYRVKLRHRLLQVQKLLQRDLRRRTARRRGSAAPGAALACRTIEQQLVAQAAAASAGFGAPSVVFGMPDRRYAGRRGGAARTDYGPALVDLIQRTISPDFWDVNGGPGSIAYYPLWYALVVRATGEIHGQVGKLTRDLRH